MDSNNPSPPIALETHDLTVTYNKRPVLYGIDVAIESGSLVGIIGPNGAGKSTFIKAILDVVHTSGGWVKIFGKPLAKNRHRVGYVPQRESVDWDFPVTVLDVVLMGTYGQLGLFKRPNKSHRKKALQALEKVSMLPYANRQIAQLSGGQQQRVFLARALAQDSELYLMDEPFVGVDAATEAAIVALLKDMRDRGKTVLVVHHDLHSACDYFDHLLLLNMRLIRYGSIQETFTHELLKETYGGRLTALSQVVDKIAHMEE